MIPITRNLAIIIGINAYQPQNGISPLKTAVNDATKLASILENRYQYRVQLLTDTDATLGQLQQLLATLERGTIALPNETIHIVESDRLLFYFAGHGIAANELDNQGAPKGYLVPQDATQNQNTFLPMSDLHDISVELPCRHLLIFLDCCFAGSFRWAGGRRDILPFRKMYRERYDRFTNGIAQQVITSAAFDEKALDSIYRFGQREPADAQQQYSPFAQLLFKLLEAKPNKNGDKFIDAILEDGIITATEIYAYLQGAIAQLTTEQTPGFCQLIKHDKGEYIFPLPGFQPKELPTAEVLTKSLNPYRGLEPYERHHHQLFFGRTKLRKKLAAFVSKQQLTVVSGASGSGKSSLVKAGLIPDLDKLETKAWQILRPIRPGERPFTALNFALKDGGLPTVIQGENTENFNSEQLRKIVLAWSRKNPELKLLIVIDQFEELITRCRSDRDREDFLELLGTTLQSEELSNQFRLVVTLRSDFEPQFGDTVLSSHWQQSKFKVTPMSREELREAIVEPAAARVMFFESPQLIEKLIDEVIDMPGALPLLSFTLSELYFKYIFIGRGDRTIREADYRELGGVMLSLTKRGDMTCEELKEEGVGESTIRNVMLRMVATRSGELAGRPVTARELEYPEPENEDVGKIIKAFTDARLLVGDSSKSESYVEPAHDELVRGWPRIKRWLDERADAPVERRGGIQRLFEALFLGLKRDSNRRDNTELERPLKVNLPLQRELTTAANNWLGKKQKEGDKKAIGFLWDRDPRLPQLEEIGESEENWFNKTEASFVKGSIRRNRNNRLRLMGAVASFIGLVLGFAGIQYVLRIDAEIQSLAANSDVLYTSNRKLEALIEALKAGLKLNKAVWAGNETRARVSLKLQQAVYGVKEKNRLEKEHTQPIRSVAFSPVNSQIIATASEDKTIKIWNGNGILLRTLEGHEGEVDAISFSPDGKTIASAGWDDTVKVWNVEDGTLIRTLVGHASHVYAVSFSPDGKTIASGSYDRTVKIWNASDGTLRLTLKEHSSAVSDVSFSSDGQFFASASWDGTIKIWTIDGSLVRTLEDDEDRIFGISFSSDGKTIASAGENNLKVWDANTGQVQFIRGVYIRNDIVNRKGDNIHKDKIYDISFNSNGQFLFSAGEDKTIKIWNQHGTLLQTLVGHSREVNRLAFSSDGTMASASWDETVKLWNTDNSVLLHTLEMHNTFYDGISYNASAGGGSSYSWNRAAKQKPKPKANTLTFSRDRKMVAAAGVDNTVKVWKADGTLAYLLKGHQSSVSDVSFSPDSKTLASIGSDATIELWNLENGDLLHTISVMEAGGAFGPRQGWIHQTSSVSFTPDGKTIISTSFDGKVNFWNADDAKWLDAWVSHSSPVYGISVSPNGKRIALANRDNTIGIWTTDGKLLRTLRYSSPVYRVSFSSDSKTVAAASLDGNIQLWNANSGSRLATLEGHQAEVTDIDFSSNGRIIVSGSLDNTIKIWTADGVLLHSLEEDRTQPLAVGFSPDGNTVVYVSEKIGRADVISWNLNLQSLLERGCNWVRDYLNNPNINISESDRHLCDDILNFP